MVHKKQPTPAAGGEVCCFDVSGASGQLDLLPLDAEFDLLTMLLTAPPGLQSHRPAR